MGAQGGQRVGRRLRLQRRQVPHHLGQDAAEAGGGGGVVGRLVPRPAGQHLVRGQSIHGAASGGFGVVGVHGVLAPGPGAGPQGV